MKKGSCLPNVFSQVIYSGGYSDGEPPLPIPNREAKPVIADGTARPGGRVGSRRAWKESSDERSSGDSFSCLWVCEGMPSRTFRFSAVGGCGQRRSLQEGPTSAPVKATCPRRCRCGLSLWQDSDGYSVGIENYQLCSRLSGQLHTYSYPSFVHL